MKAVLIDDENKGLSVLQKLIKKHIPDMQIVGMTNNPIEAEKLINTKQPDIVFIDIEMPHINGIELIKNIPNKKFGVIYTTAYDHYAIQAIKTGVFDYILKPIDKDELIAAYHRFKNQHIETNKRPGNETGILTVPVTNGFTTLNIDDIVCIKADGAYSDIYTKENHQLKASKALSTFTDKLPANFFRAHHSHIINLKLIVQYVNGRGGYVIMTTGMKLDISQRHKTQFLRAVKK